MDLQRNDDGSLVKNLLNCSTILENHPTYSRITTYYHPKDRKKRFPHPALNGEPLTDGDVIDIVLFFERTYRLHFHPRFIERALSVMHWRPGVRTDNTR